MIQASDFESDIVEFVMTSARNEGLSGIEDYINATCKRANYQYSIPALLQAISEEETADPVRINELEFILAQLRKTLSSIESTHSSSRFICD